MADAEAAAAATFDPSAVHKALDAAEKEYHKLFDGHVPDEVRRFIAHLGNLHTFVDQAADEATKEQI